MPLDHTDDPVRDRCSLSSIDCARPYHGLTPKAFPVLQAKHATTGLVADGALGAHGQVAFEPLVRHGNLRRGRREGEWSGRREEEEGGTLALKKMGRGLLLYRLNRGCPENLHSFYAHLWAS